MSDKLLQIIEKQIDLYLEPSFVDLGIECSNLIQTLTPGDLKKYSDVIDDFLSLIVNSINSHFREITTIIKKILNEYEVQITQDISDNIYNSSTSKLKAYEHLSRFSEPLEMIHMHFSRMGFKFDKSKYSNGLSPAKYEIAIKESIRRNSEKLKSELDILCFSSSQIKSNFPTLMEKSRVEKFVEKVKNHKVLSVIVILFIFVVAIGAFTDALDKVLSFKAKYLEPAAINHPATSISRDTVAAPAYEFYFQPTKTPTNPDGSKNYEIGFKNLTSKPLLNFQFVLYFRQPVESVTYDFKRSTANFTGGDGLSPDNTRYHWLGNQIMEDREWVVFFVKTRNVPAIRKVSTKLLGKNSQSGKLIEPDPEGLQNK